MGGVVNTVRKVADPFITQVRKDVVGMAMSGPKAIQSLSRGEGLQKAISANLHSSLDPGLDLVKGAKSAFTGEDKNVPNIAAEDPELKAQRDQAARARAKRQEEVNLLTGQPGRGGTVLTDNYNYKV